VRELSEAAARIAAGQLDTRVHARTRDELGKLADAFNAMIPKLESGLAMRQSLRLAREVQSNLLPDGPPEFEGLDCAGVSYSADETGGDYFDFIDLRTWGDDRLLIAVGDVVGHGVAAALLMATARANLRSRARPLGALDALFNDVNRLLAEDVRNGQFMSLLLMAVDPPARRVTWVNAGHNPPLHFHASTGTVDELHTGNPPLGVLSEWTFQPSPAVPIERGDLFLLGTDGIWEAQNATGEQYGHERLRKLLRDLHARPAEAIVRSVREELERFMAGTRQADDITIVVAKVL
jgi:sigma-B regulation protein RsbU (phosphoserine phosphatase)